MPAAASLRHPEVPEDKAMKRPDLHQVERRAQEGVIFQGPLKSRLFYLLRLAQSRLIRCHFAAGIAGVFHGCEFFLTDMIRSHILPPAEFAGENFRGRITEMAWIISHCATAFTGVSHCIDLLYVDNGTEYAVFPPKACAAEGVCQSQLPVTPEGAREYPGVTDGHSENLNRLQPLSMRHGQRS